MLDLVSHLDDTLSLIDEEDEPQDAAVASRLIVVFQCTGRMRPSRHILANVDEVIVVRGDKPRAHRSPLKRQLVLVLADPYVSSPHARLERMFGHWVIDDKDSKNGVRINGAFKRHAVLADGDVIEIGESFLMFQERVAVEDQLDLELRPAEAALELPTLHGELARDLRALALGARSDLPIVVMGETGTGKEVVARAVHAYSARTGPLVAVNCGALADNLIESELFGYKRGAFSGALEDRPGLFRAADGGTLLLDEVGDLPERTQVALLRVLQEREVLAVGATRPVPIDVRLIAATHRDLRTLVAKGSFRADLYARLAGFQITLPALRERREDLGMLVHALIARLAPCRNLTIGIKAARAIFRHTWPLNVRELERCLASALVLASGDKLDFLHLPDDVKRALAGAPDLPKLTSAESPMTVDGPPETLIESERRHVTSVLEYTGWQKRSAAEILGISRPTLDRKIRQLGLARSASRDRSRPDDGSNALAVARSSISPHATKRRR